MSRTLAPGDHRVTHMINDPDLRTVERMAFMYRLTFADGRTEHIDVADVRNADPVDLEDPSVEGVLSYIQSRIDCREANSTSPTWPYVMKFARRMEKKLAANRHKGDREGWLSEPQSRLFARLVEEVGEVAEALATSADAQEVANELADVANFAMMLADVILEQGHE